MQHHDVLTVLGFPCDPYNGSYYWHKEEPSAEIVNAVEIFPTEDAGLIAIDLETDPRGQVLATLVSGSAMEAFKTWQCETIRSMRKEAYRLAGITPEQYLNAAWDGSPSVDAIRQARDTEKAKYPWPGNYR